MIKIHKEGYPTLLLSFILFSLIGLLFYYKIHFLFYPILALGLVTYFILIWFFRNPVRTIPTLDDSLIYAPADGKVVVIEETEETEFYKEKRIQISIFMSPLNVHVNRYPFGGKIEYIKYHPGRYLVAWHPKSSTENERSTIVIKSSPNRSVLLRQIAGALARRIVFYSKKDVEIKQGATLGFIKFGSRVDLFLPLDADIKVNIGDKVKGNIDVIAHFNN